MWPTTPSVDYTQREQTSVNASNLNRKWSGIQIQISGLIRIQVWMSAGFIGGLLPKCRGFITLSVSVIWPSVMKISRWQYMSNANKFPTISWSTMVRKVEKWSGICTRDQISAIKSLSVLPTGRSNHNSKFHRNQLITFVVILPTNRIRQNKWMNEWQTASIARPWWR